MPLQEGGYWLSSSVFGHTLMCFFLTKKSLNDCDDICVVSHQSCCCGCLHTKILLLAVTLETEEC